MNNWYVYKVHADHYAAERRREADSHRRRREQASAHRSAVRSTSISAANPTRTRRPSVAGRLRSLAALILRPDPGRARVSRSAQPVPCGHGTPAP